MKIYLAADHAGYKIKEAVRVWLISKKYKIEDLGAVTYHKNDDYPDFMHQLGRALVKDRRSLGVIFGGSGQGEAMVANRYKGVRAVVYYGGPVKVITLARQHNNANVLSLAGFFLSEQEAIKAVDLWLKTKFSGDNRHKRRIKKID